MRPGEYASGLLKAGLIRHTVNKITFSEQCYYVFGDLSGGCRELSAPVLAQLEWPWWPCPSSPARGLAETQPGLLCTLSSKRPSLAPELADDGRGVDIHLCCAG